MELAGKAERLEGPSVPRHYNDPSVVTDGADRLVQGRGGAGNLDDDIRPPVAGQGADFLGHAVVGGQYNFGTEALSQLASVLYGVDSDDDGNSCPSKKLDETETDHAEAAHHNHVTEGWSGVEYPVEGGVQVGRQHAHPRVV
jgi:hypothetical protein